jgi:RNA polymerase sigma-70 factor (ECF subfamily)
MLGTEADAEDAVDAALYNAWRHIKALREPRFFTTWVTRILINECNAALRRRKRETPAGETAISAQTCEYYDALPIREAVRQLPDELRTVIGLRYFADLTVPVVAGILKLPQGTVKSRQRKALALLRVELQE